MSGLWTLPPIGVSRRNRRRPPRSQPPFRAPSARCRRDLPIPAQPTPVGVSEISRGSSAANTPGPRPTHIASTLQGCQKARVNTINAGKKRPPGPPPHTAHQRVGPKGQPFPQPGPAGRETSPTSVRRPNGPTIPLRRPTVSGKRLSWGAERGPKAPTGSDGSNGTKAPTGSAHKEEATC
jgi:hypothetical protein